MNDNNNQLIESSAQIAKQVPQPIKSRPNNPRKNPPVKRQSISPLHAFTDLTLPSNVFDPGSFAQMDMIPVKHNTEILLDFRNLFSRMFEALEIVHSSMSIKNMNTSKKMFGYHILVLVRRLLEISSKFGYQVPENRFTDSLPTKGLLTVVQMFDTFGHHEISSNLTISPLVTSKLIRRLLAVSKRISDGNNFEPIFANNFQMFENFMLYGRRIALSYLIGKDYSSQDMKILTPTSDPVSIGYSIKTCRDIRDLEPIVEDDNFIWSCDKIIEIRNRCFISNECKDMCSRVVKLPLYQTGDSDVNLYKLLDIDWKYNFYVPDFYMRELHKSNVGIRSMVCYLQRNGNRHSVVTAEDGCDKISIYMASILGMQNEPVSRTGRFFTMFNFQEPDRRTFDFVSPPISKSISEIRSFYYHSCRKKFY